MHFSSTLLLLIAVQLLTQNALSAGITCPKSTDFPNCMCDATSFHYPKWNPSLEIELSSNGEELDVICHDDNFGDLSNLHIGNINILVVKNCGASAGQPLLESIRFVGVNSTKKLHYENWKNKYSFTVRTFEDLQDLEQLVLVGSVKHIASDAFSKFHHLQRMDIRNNKELINFQLGVFDGLENLVNLALDSNGISELESGIFRNQHKLQKLVLSQNSLCKFNNSTFQGLQNLKLLDLSSNEIESLSTDTFSILPNLNELNLSFNRLTIISGNLTANRKLNKFLLTGNRVPLVLSEHSLSHLPELQEVNLQNSTLSHLPENLFRESKAIVTLNLSRNMLKSLPESLLYDQSNLENLRLDNNRLEALPDQLFTNTTKLTDLQLAGNQLYSISGNVFATLAKLKVLHLENNKLHLIDDKTFKGTVLLQQLYLQNNRLSFEAKSYTHMFVNININKPTPLQYLKNLHVLNLRNNSITTIFEDWQTNTVQLKELDLSYNRISELIGLYNLNFFSYEINVDLSHNRISHISELDLGQNMSNVKIRLTGNPLSCNCNLLEFVQYVKAKNDSYIKFITDDLRCSQPQELIGTSLSALRTLDLTCPLTGNTTGCPSECNCIARPADRTIVVNCTGRGLTEIRSLPEPSSIGYHFIQLHIENNFFRELPTLKLPGYEAVVSIHAQGNLLDRVSETNLPIQLRLIDLTQNRLKTLSKPVLEVFNNSAYLTNVQLSNNPWTCNCSNEDFMQFIQGNLRKLSTDNSQIVCEDSRRIDSLNVSELCHKTTSDVLFLLVLGCSGLLMWILSAFYYSYQIEIKVWLFTHNLFLWFEELDKDKLYDAFISYSQEDAPFVERELVPRMENLMNFKICIHDRDWIPDEMNSEQMFNSLEISRRLVIVLSKHYLESTWAQMEFRTAHRQSLTEKRVPAIIIVSDDIENIESLDSELKAYLKMNITYVYRDDPWFWDKLRYAMPHQVPPTSAGPEKNEKGKLTGQPTTFQMFY